MKHSKHEKGFALVVVVLSSIVLLGILFAAVSSVSISTRRVTSDQATKLTAQYASESGLSRIIGDTTSTTGDLRAWAGLLSSMVLPTLTTNQVADSAAKFCNLAITPTTWAATIAASTTAVTLCDAPESVTVPTYPANVANRFQIFSNYISRTAPAGGTLSPYQRYLSTNNYRAGLANTPTTAAEAETFWQGVFDSGQANKYIVDTSTDAASGTRSRYLLRYGMTPVRVTASAGGQAINFVFRSSQVTAIGQVASGTGSNTKVLSERINMLEASGEFQIQIEPASFAYFAMLTNQQAVVNGSSTFQVNFANSSLFDGPVHTNGNFSYSGKSWFSDKLTSSGCSGTVSMVAGSPVCSSAFTPGAYVAGTSTLIAGNPPTITSTTTYPQTVKDGSSIATPTQYAHYNYKGDYAQGLIPLPTVTTQQETDANTNGILLDVKGSGAAVGATVALRRMEIAAKTATGADLNPDPTSRPDAAYQFFRFYQTNQLNNCRAPATSVTVNPVSRTKNRNQTQNITATTFPSTNTETEAAADPAVTWTLTSGTGSLSVSGAAVNKVTQYTAPNANTTAKVTAKTQYGTNKTAVSTITVTVAPPPGPPPPPPGPPPPPAPSTPTPSFSMTSAPANTAVAGPCNYGAAINYPFLYIHEYRSSVSGSTMLLEERTYPDDNNDEWNLPATAPAWSSGWTTARSNFNGVVYVKGSDVNLAGPWRWSDASPDQAPPAVAKFAKLSIVGTGNINIQADIKYEKPLCYDGNGKKSYPERNGAGAVITANCDVPGSAGIADNVLGIYTAGAGKNVEINPSYRDMTIHGVVMAARGAVRVTGAGPESGSTCPTNLVGTGVNLNKGMGNVRLLGGVIEDSYGVWGRLNGTGDINCGYGRSVTYDKRMQDPTVKPPSFPTTSSTGTWGIKLFRTDQGASNYLNRINPVSATDQHDTPLPVIKGTRKSTYSN